MTDTKRQRDNAWILVPLSASSMFVLVEPAPFDVLNVMIAFLALLVRPPIIYMIGGLVLLCFAFALARGITLFIPEDIELSLRYFVITTYLSVSACILAGYIAYRGPIVVTYLIWGLYLGTAITGGAYILTQLGSESLRSITMAHSQTRFQGFYKDPNVLGPAVVPVVVFALAGLVSSQRRTKWIHLSMLVASSALIVVTLSRGAWLSAIVAFLVFSTLSAWLLGAWRIIASIAMFCVVVCIVVTFAGPSEMVQDLQERIDQRSGEQHYDRDRFAVQEHLWELFLQHPFGHGPGESNVFAESLNAERSNAAHNTYIRVAFENGLLGLFIFICLIITTLLAGARGLRSALGLQLVYAASIAVIVSIAANSFFIDTLHWRHLWMFIGIVWGLAAWDGNMGLQRSTGQSASGLDLGAWRSKTV